jgi:adenylate cyclase class 2
MYEVELKVEADHDEVRRRLTALGADPLGTVEQVDTYYEHPVRDFGETDEAFRVRRETDDEGTETRVTYKGPLVEESSKTREEFETGVEDGETMERMLEELGFEPFEAVEKRRERFACEGYTVTLDTVAGLGEYVEVETEAADIEPAREGAVALMTDLDLDPGEQVRTSYLGLLLESRGE